MPVNFFPILLSSVVIVLTCILTFVGVQVFLILKEAQKTVKKINLLLDEGKEILTKTSQAMEGTVGFLSGLRTIFKLLRVFSKKKKKDE